MVSLTVPFLDLKAQYEGIRHEIKQAINSVLENQIFILGDEVVRLEQELARYLGVKYVVTLNSGTDALILSLRVLGIGKGDEVITQPNSFIATTLAITEVGATPVFVDIDPDTLQIDVNKVESVITNRTKAISPVHLYGAPCQIDKLKTISIQFKLSLIEDAAQAFGSKYQGRMLGTFGDLGIYSFYPGKNLGAYGDGGAIATNNRTLYKKLMLLRNYGQEKKYHHTSIGINSRLDEIQATVLRVKLKYINRWNSKRNEHALFYRKNMPSQILTPSVQIGGTSNYHIYPVRLPEKYRDKLIDYLANNNIHALIHYPIPIHLQKCYTYLGYRKGDFPNAEMAARESLSLPMFAEIKRNQLKYVCDTISDYLLK